MKRYFLLSAFAFCSLALSAQETQEITLNEAIALARTQSVDAAVALNELKTAYWEYRTFRADLLPEVNFSGTLPSYSKQYNSYQNEDGSYSFVRSNKLGLNGALSIDQNIWFTGGKVSLSSSLDFMKQLGSGGSRQFMSVPIALQLTQPIFGVNNLKWNRRIEPVRYEEAKAAFITATETVTMNAITYFFNLLSAKETLGTARQNQVNADRLYEVAGAKRKMGQISENELLQLKLAALKARAAVTDAESNLNAHMFRSAFTRDQYGSIGRSNTCYRIQYLHQPTAFAYDMAPVECSALLLRSVFGSGSQFECRLDALQQSSVIPGFRDKVECTGLHPLYSQLYTAPGSHQNDRDIGTKNLYLF
jgi:outer membrane protein TolC